MRYLIASIAISASVLFLGAPAFAGQCICKDKCNTTAAGTECDSNAQCSTKPECPPPGTAAGSVDKPVGIPLPLGNVSVQGLVGRIIKTILGLVGSLALVMFIYGGFLYMTSAGNEEKVTKGKNTLVWAILGLIAVFGAYSVVDYIIKQINK